MNTVESLLAKHRIISDQVSVQDLQIILGELEQIQDNKVSGDVVEFGCYKGTTSLFIHRLLDMRREGRIFHVYDSFEGLPAKGWEDGSAAGDNFRAGQLAVSKKEFIREFQKARLQPPVIHKEWFDQLTTADVPSKIAFAFLDGDFYASIKTSLQLVLPRMSAGSVIVIHDFGREALPGVARAVESMQLSAKKVGNLGVIKFP